MEEHSTKNHTEHIRLVLEIIGVIAAVALAVITLCTLRVFNNQFREMQKQSKTLSEQASQAASDSARQLQLAGEQVKALQDQVTAIQRQMRLDERAWLTVQSIRVVTLQAGKPADVEVEIENTGRTITKDGNIKGYIYLPNLYITNYSRPREARYSPPKELPTQFPNSPGFIPMATDVPLTAAQVEEITVGRRYLFVWAEIIYRDIFGQNHHTNYCGVFVPSTRRFETCHNFKYEAD